MLSSPKPNPLNKLCLKLCALIFGYTLWSGFTEHHKIQKAVGIPLSFFNAPEKIQIDAPETVQLTLYGTRRALAAAHYEGSVHCNGSKLTEGTHTVALHDQQIFLPKTVLLLHCVPDKITLSISAA